MVEVGDVISWMEVGRGYSIPKGECFWRGVVLAVELNSSNELNSITYKAFDGGYRGINKGIVGGVFKVNVNKSDIKRGTCVITKSKLVRLIYG